SPSEPNPVLNPDFRIRINTFDFQANALAVVNGMGTGQITPRPGSPREITTYLVLNGPPSTSDALLAFDLLSFDKPMVSDQRIELDSITVERIRISEYPTPE